MPVRQAESRVRESELLGARLRLLQYGTCMQVLRMKLEILEEGDPGSGGDR